jgi:hypothetical protein
VTVQLLVDRHLGVGHETTSMNRTNNYCIVVAVIVVAAAFVDMSQLLLSPLMRCC